jgi:hypothetical protein
MGDTRSAAKGRSALGRATFGAMRGAFRAALRTLLPGCALALVACSDDVTLDTPVPPRPTTLPAAAARPVQADFVAPTRPPPSLRREAPETLPAPPIAPAPGEPDNEPEAAQDAGNGLPL